MRFINRWAYSCAGYLAAKMEQDHKKRSIYYFSFQVLIGQALQILLMVLFSLLFKSFIPTMVIIISYAALRVNAGGYHMSTYGKCTLLSLVIYIASGIIVKYVNPILNMTYLYVFALISFITILGIIIKWAPKDNPHREITKPKEKTKFKVQSIIIVLAWAVISIVLLHYKLTMYVIAGYIGFLLEVLTVTPGGYALFEKVNLQLDEVKLPRRKIKAG